MQHRSVQCNPPVAIRSATVAERAVLTGIINDPECGLFAVFAHGRSQRIVPVTLADLATFPAFAEHVRNTMGIDTAHPRRGWKAAVRNAIERGASL